MNYIYLNYSNYEITFFEFSLQIAKFSYFLCCCDNHDNCCDNHCLQKNFVFATMSRQYHVYHLPYLSRYLVVGITTYLVFQGKCKNVARKKKISMQQYISFIFIACKERFGSLIQNQKWLFDTLVFFSDPHELATTDMRRRGVGNLGLKSHA